MSLLKSPMGLMVGFMVIVVFLVPKLMENMGNMLLVQYAALQFPNPTQIMHWLLTHDLISFLLLVGM